MKNLQGSARLASLTRLPSRGAKAAALAASAGGIVCRHQDGEAGELLAPGADDGDGES
jgi:hypothetical protein